ncbi:MAG: hypothetical protein QM689_07050 [Oscillospiraceae bacterium]
MFSDYLLNTLELQTSQGIISELYYLCQHILNDKIAYFSINVDENQIHEVKITMNEFSEKNAAILFHKMAEFLEFGYLNYYTKVYECNYVEYRYVTASNDSWGYYINITIK